MEEKTDDTANLLQRMIKAALEKKCFSKNDFFSEIVKTVGCQDCNHVWDIKDILLTKVIECPVCGAVFDNYTYDEEMVKKTQSLIEKPANCIYDFSDGIYPCLTKEGDFCNRECYYNGEQKYTFANGECDICGAGLDYDKYCENCS